MPRPPMDDFWRQQIRYLKANPDEGREWNATSLARKLEIIAGEAGRDDPPHRTTVQRELGRIEPDELNQYRWVRWPYTFEAGLLPWESARAVIDLISVSGIVLPTVRVARWFLRITQAAPDAPMEDRKNAAHTAASWESAGRTGADMLLLGVWLTESLWRMGHSWPMDEIEQVRDENGDEE